MDSHKKNSWKNFGKKEFEYWNKILNVSQKPQWKLNDFKKIQSSANALLFGSQLLAPVGYFLFLDSGNKQRFDDRIEMYPIRKSETEYYDVTKKELNEF